MGSTLSLRIKICGFTTERGIDAAIELGVHAIGLVLDPSPRKLTIDRAAALKARVPKGVDVVAVCGRPSTEELEEIVNSLQPDVIQLMADATVPAAMDANWLFAFDDGPDLHKRIGEYVQSAEHEHPIVLVDGPQPGSGIPADWERVRALHGDHRLIIAGGLNAGNVGEAIRRLQPYGVDVCSGVESSVGVKDPDRMAAFVAAVRSAQTPDPSP